MTVLSDAADAVSGPREDDYGRPIDNHTTTAVMFQQWLSRRYRKAVKFDAVDVCAFNIVQKLGRLANSPKHRDSLVDIAGYAENWDLVLQPREMPVVEKPKENVPFVEEIEPSLADLEEAISGEDPAAAAFDEAAKEDDVYKNWRLRSLVQVPVLEGVEQSNWPCPLCGDKLALETIAHVCEDGYAHPHEFIKIVATDGSTTAK